MVILVATGILPGTVKSSQTSSNSKKRNILWTSLLFQFQFSQLIEQTPTRNHHQKRFKRATKTAFFRVPKPSEKRSRMMFIHWLRPQTSASWHSLTSWWFEWQKVQQIWKWSDIYIYTYYLSSWWFRFNPFEKYDRQNGSFPQVGRDENKKIFELPPPSLRLEVLMNVKELKVLFPV